MQFSRKLAEKINLGDKLSDTELQVALDHFEAMEALLLRSGAEWGIALQAAIRETNGLRGFRDARKRDDRYRPADRGVFDITYRDGEYRVSVPDYDGGKVVTIERHEAAVADARFEGRMSKVPGNAAALTVEVLEALKTSIQGRCKGGAAQDVIEDILSNVVDPAINLAKSVQKAA